MDPLRVERVDPQDRRSLRALQAAWARLYEGDAAWVPPLDAWLRRRLAPTNPFFRDAELRLYVARRGDEILGSISSLNDRRHARVRDEKVAFFGFFETIDDPTVAHALLDQATADASAWGARLLRGPRNLSRVEELGITIQGHASRPPLLASHHRPYLAPLVEALGFTRHHDVLAYDRLLVEPDGRPTPIPDKLRDRGAACALPGLEVRPVRLARLDRDLGLAHQVFVEAFRDVPENTPMPRDQFVHLGRAFVWLTSRHLLQLATVDGQAAGFGICVPELNEAIQQARGHLFPLGWARALRQLPRIQTASFKLIGVMPAFRGRGLNARLILAVVEGLQAAGYRRVEGSLIDERNEASRATVEGLGLEVYRRYRVYERPV